MAAPALHRLRVHRAHAIARTLQKNYGVYRREQRCLFFPGEFEISEIQLIITMDRGELHSLLRP